MTRRTLREHWSVLTTGERLALAGCLLAGIAQMTAVLRGFVLAAMACGGINGYLAMRLIQSLKSRKGTDL